MEKQTKENLKTVGILLGVVTAMICMGFWLFTPMEGQIPNYPPSKPSPKPHIVVLDTFSPVALKQEINRQNILYSNIVYAQARLETGNFKSQVFKENNNLFGFVGNNGYIKYNSWQESVKDYKEWQNKYYVRGDYYTFLKRVGYAEDTSYIYKLRNF